MIEENLLFPTKILKIKCKDWENKKDKLLNLVDWDNPQYKSKNHISDYHQNQVNGCPYMTEFCDILRDDLRSFLAYKDKDTLNIGTLWGQRYKNSDYMHTHSHGAIGYSAVLYVEFNKEEHSATRFIAPHHNPEGELDYYQPDVEEGDLIIFPSSLYHDASPSLSEMNRTIFSFNFMV